MNVKEAINEAARHFAQAGNFRPSHCDVRCLINDLTEDNPGVRARGYDQDRAHNAVCRILSAAEAVR